jgi:hypothetical protein
MPEGLGGIRMVISVAELARAGITPNWMPGVVPRCVPVETKSNQHGERATTIVVGVERVLTRGKWRTVEVLACTVTWRRIQNRSQLPGVDMRIGGRRWIGCGAGCWRAGCCEMSR